MMDTLSSSDEDDDRQHLIHQNDAVRKSQSPPQRRQRSSFSVDGDAKTRFSNATGSFLKLNISKWYLIAIFVPIFIIILYFTTDIKSMFQSNVWKVNYDASANQMREAELQALNLLKQQQLGLFKLWNHSLVFNDNNSVNSTSDVKIESNNLMINDLKSYLLSQISLNKQIQQVLLSSHQLENSLDSSEYNATDPSIGGWERCGKVDQKFAERRTIEWKPRADKYLFAICTSGQMSNHLICLEKHIFFAALLNRVLVIPSSKIDYEFSRVLDVDHINKCVGRTVVVTFEEFAESKKSHLHIDKFICYFSSPQPCYLDDEHIKKLKSLGVSMSKIEAAWVENVKKPNQRAVKDVVAKFSSDDDVIAVGDLFFADVESGWVMQPGGPIAHKCKILIEPSRLIMLTAQRFVQTFLGKDFIALHFRRHGFLKFCNVKKPSCFYPVPQASECINRVVERANVPVIYLSTDAAESETSLLQSLVNFNGKAVPLVKRPARDSAVKWDALLYRHGLEGDSQVKMKLVNLGHAQSEETRIKIGLGVRMGWEKRREKLMLQETCYYEWQNLIAEASRNGLLGEEELQWGSYKILDKQLEQEWLQSVEERKKMRRPKGSKRAPKSPEQRKKISEAIAAKWADPGYRTRVTSALAKYHGIPEGAERKPRRKPSGNGEPRKGRTPKKKVNDADEFEKFEKKTLRVKVKKSKAPRFKDPLASSKLEMLKSIRAQRASSENKKSEAIARAKVLIAEAEKAAKALEAAAEKSPIAYASLIETRKLIAEAIESIERAELDSNEVENSSHLTSSDPFEEFNAEMGSLNETDHKTVNGKHILPTSMNGIDDIDLEEFALHSMLNGSSYHIHTLNGKENLSLRSTSDYDLSPEEVNDLVKHSGQLHDPELDGSEQNIQSLLADEERAHSEVVESPKSINVIKKWVRGRLVEVVEEGKSS